MRSVYKNQFNKEVYNLINSVDDVHKRRIILNVLQLLADMENSKYLECIEVFVSTLASDDN